MFEKGDTPPQRTVHYTCPCLVTSLLCASLNSLRNVHFCVLACKFVVSRRSSTCLKLLFVFKPHWGGLGGFLEGFLEGLGGC